VKSKTNKIIQAKRYESLADLINNQNSKVSKSKTKFYQDKMQYLINVRMLGQRVRKERGESKSPMEFN